MRSSRERVQVEKRSKGDILGYSTVRVDETEMRHVRRKKHQVSVGFWVPSEQVTANLKTSKKYFFLDLFKKREIQKDLENNQ